MFSLLLCFVDYWSQREADESSRRENGLEVAGGEKERTYIFFFKREVIHWYLPEDFITHKIIFVHKMNFDNLDNGSIHQVEG